MKPLWPNPLHFLSLVHGNEGVSDRFLVQVNLQMMEDSVLKSIHRSLGYGVPCAGPEAALIRFSLAGAVGSILLLDSSFVFLDQGVLHE